jgi:hypothetical protein
MAATNVGSDGNGSEHSNGITIKTVYQGDTRRFVLDDVKDRLFANLAQTVRVVYKLDDTLFTLSYIDDEVSDLIITRSAPLDDHNLFITHPPSFISTNVHMYVCEWLCCV